MAAPIELVVVFGTIALFETLDRTNFALLSLAAREAPLPAWLGAVSAFAITTLIAVLLGGAAVVFLRPDLGLVRLAGGLLLLAYAAYLALRRDEERPPAPAGSTLATAFSMILLLELGDTTMILTIGFVTAYAEPLLVGLAAFLGLAAVAGGSCLLGPHLGARLAPRQLDRYVVVILAVVGTATVLYAVDPGLFAPLAG